MSKTVEFKGLFGGILQCRGPQPENPATKSLEVFVGFSADPATKTRTIKCDYLIMAEDNTPRCNALNRLGIAAQPQDQSGIEILSFFDPEVNIVKDERKLGISSLPEDHGQVPYEHNYSKLPTCRLFDLVVI